MTIVGEKKIKKEGELSLPFFIFFLSRRDVKITNLVRQK